MSELGKYLFLPWLRRGMATQITKTDSASAARAEFKVSVSFRDPSASLLSTKPISLALYGSGDVVGFDMRAVLRTWPARDVFEVESNYFPLIEFDQPDLPWRYTPAPADKSQDRLLPWLCLIAVKDDEFEFEDVAGSNRRLPAVKVKSAVLPNLNEAWAWAHVQVVGAKGITAENVQEVVNLAPRQALARIICPRRLESKTPYTCFLVPVFERGRRTGLNEEQDNSINGLQTAWQSDPSKRAPIVVLPVYYHWRFQTGGSGDFESLVRKLTPRMLASMVGKRNMLVDNPGAGLPSPVASSSEQVMALEGALQQLAAKSTEWAETDRKNWIEKLKSLLNLSFDRLKQTGGEKTITPPLYGRWHAARETISGSATSQPIWFERLNIDPRLRVAAGLGAIVVQDQREALLASAWQQVERIRAINEELRFAQLAREAAKSLKERHLDKTDTDSLLAITSQVHSLIKLRSATISAHIQASPIPSGVLDPSWRRVARRMGPLGVRQGRIEQPAGTDLLARLNDGRLAAARPPKVSPQLPTPDQITTAEGRLDEEQIKGRPPSRTAPYEPDFRDPTGNWQWAPEDVVQPPPAPPNIPIDDTVGKINTPAKPISKKKVNLDEIKEVILKALNPDETIAQPLCKRLHKPAGWQPKDPIEPVMAYPEFPQPMYEPLRDLSQDWVFPGLDKVEVNTLALLAPNQSFIEAYLVGLNYEMARALLFNEYPTDQRGCYFRQFWDARGCADSASPDEFKDIKVIHQWPKLADLGENGMRDPDKTLVLLMRGELLQRYPNAIIYAVKAKQEKPDQPRTLSSDPKDEKHPIFFGKMKPDVTFIGFGDLTTAQAKGSEHDPGWFFVIQEQPSEPRFGLAVDATGDADKPVDLSWQHFAKNDDELKQLNYLSFAASLPKINDTQGAKWPQPRASDIAFVTLRKPYRVAIHASEMIL